MTLDGVFAARSGLNRAREVLLEALLESISLDIPCAEISCPMQGFFEGLVPADHQSCNCVKDLCACSTLLREGIVSFTRHELVVGCGRQRKPFPSPLNWEGKGWDLLQFSTLLKG